jgi:hypothetical protein
MAYVDGDNSFCLKMEIIKKENEKEVHRKKKHSNLCINFSLFYKIVRIKYSFFSS